MQNTLKLSIPQASSYACFEITILNLPADNQPPFGLKYIIVIHQIIHTYVQMSNCVCFSDGSCQSQWVWQCCSCTLVLLPSPSPCLPASSAAPSNTILHIIDIGRHWEESVVDPDPVQSGTFRPGQIGKSH